MQHVIFQTLLQKTKPKAFRHPPTAVNFCNFELFFQLFSEANELKYEIS